MKRLAFAAALVGLLAAGARPATAIEVKLKLPMKAKLDLTGKSTVAIAPFIVIGKEKGEGRAGRSVDVQKEFARYLTKLLRRDTPLKMVEFGPVDYPTYDLEVLATNKDFWRALGDRGQADLIVAGSLDFDIQDKSGYRTEEYVSPFDGRTYYRQVLVEQTGFEYDIVLMVFDGKTGERLYFDNFKDFKQFDSEKADPLHGMFENLVSLEDRIAGVFAQKTVEASRVLFTD